MKNEYSISVGTSAVTIVPDIYATGTAFSTGAVSAGDYVEAGGRLYWAITGGTAVSEPTHKGGVETVDGIDWLHVDKNRHVIVSVHSGDEITIGRGGVPTIDDGVYVYAPYDLGCFNGPVNAISAGSVTVGVSLR